MFICKIDWTFFFQKVRVKGKHASCLWLTLSQSHEQINVTVMGGLSKCELCIVVI